MAHMKTIERRQFIKTSLFALAALVFPGNLRRALAAAPLPAGQNPVPANDPVATAIGYKAEVKDIDYKRYPARKKPEAKNQFCENCALYSKVDANYGKCSMLTSGLVANKGWCGSWSKKA